KARLGPDHPDTLLCMSNLAAGYWDVGKQNQALPLLRQAAAGMEKIRFQHQSAGPIVSNLINSYERLKQFDRSEPGPRKWLAVVKERSGADSVAYASELRMLGRNLLTQQKGAEAEPVLRESLAVCQKQQPDAWPTFHGQSMLGAALLRQQKYAEAEPLLVRGYEGLEQRQAAIRPAERRVVLAEALAWLVRPYPAPGPPSR